MRAMSIKVSRDGRRVVFSAGDHGGGRRLPQHLTQLALSGSPSSARLCRRYFRSTHRRWPSGNPRLSAFCRSAPSLRFIVLAIFLTGDLLRECALSSRKSAFDQDRRLRPPARLVGIAYLSNKKP